MSLEVDLRRILKPDVGPTCSFTTTSQSSSIGQPDDDDDLTDDDDDEQEVQSSLSSLTSLEDSLPIKKKGLSKFYTGKSKSYGNLTQVRNVKELEKSDNPFNKRKRTLMAYNLMFKTNNMINKKKKSGTGFFYSHSNHISMPILPLSQLDDHDQDHDDHDHHDDEDHDGGVVDQEQEQVNFSDTEDYFGQTSSFRLHQIKEHRPYHKSFMDNNNNNVNVVACSSSVLVSNERFRHR